MIYPRGIFAKSERKTAAQALAKGGWVNGTPAVGCAVALVATLFFAMLRAALAPLLPPDAPLLLLPAVIVAALVGGVLPGLVATAIGAAIGATLFLPPSGFAVDEPNDRLRLALFCVLGVTMSVLIECLRQAISHYQTVYAHLQAREAELGAAVRRKNQLLHMLAHELRAPLAPATTSLALLRLQPPVDPEHAQACAVLERQLTQFGRIINRLLAAVERDRAQVVLQRRSLDWATLVRHTLTDYHAVFARAGLTLRGQLPETPLWISGDPAWLLQTLAHLLDNACKFTPTGGQVTVALTADGRHARLAVTDTGVGIEGALLEQLFEPFSQAEQSLSRHQGGLGLGLYAVRQQVDRHRGTVGAISAGAGLGATFTVTLPLIEPPPATVETHPKPVDRTGVRVLVIDDDVTTADSLVKLITRLGYHVRVAYSGQTGIDAARIFRPHVVISDIGLPDRDGYEVARTLRADPAFDTLWLVALTGYGSQRDRQQARAAGFDRHLTKPADRATLQTALEQGLVQSH